jgi:methylmalonyl-CoA/ethylmalonyl-CoA epimerase
MALPDFDHVAVAAPRVGAVLESLASVGATVLFGRTAAEFRWVLTRFGEAAHGMNVEVLEPWPAAGDGFLRRFVARHGIAFHHLTFKVADLSAAIAAAQDHGLHPTGTDASDPVWKEAFIHPREAHGVLIQLAESRAERPSMSVMLDLARRSPKAAELADLGVGGGAPWMPDVAPWAPPVAVARRVLAAVDDCQRARSLFAGLLGGQPAETPRGTEIRWPSGTMLLTVSTGRPGITALEYSGDGLAAGPAAHLLAKV